MQQQGQFITLREGSEAKAVIASEHGGWLLSYSRHFPGIGYVDALHHPQAVIDRYPNQMYAGNPLLFPQVSFNWAGGQEHHFEWLGKRYPMPQHGFARRSAWKVAGVTETSVMMELSDTSETLRNYPFRFRFQVEYELKNGRLYFKQSIENRGDAVMPFSSGIHPYFNVPIAPGGLRNDCYVELPSARKITPHGNWESWTSEPSPAQHLSVGEDASGTLFITGLEKPMLRLVDPQSGFRISIDLSGAPAHRYVALWSKSTTEPFYCIEPWTALPNSFARQPTELTLLKPGEVFQATIAMELAKE